MGGLTGKEEGAAQGSENDHQYGSKNCELVSETCMFGGRRTHMDGKTMPGRTTGMYFRTKSAP